MREWLDVTPPYARGRSGFRRLAFVFDGGEELLLERLNAAEPFLPPPGADVPSPRWAWQVSFCGDRPLHLSCEDDVGAAQRAAVEALKAMLEQRLSRLQQACCGPQERRPLAR